MKKKINKSDVRITRNKAIKKIANYAALTTATMIILSAPKKAVAQSGPSSPGGW